MEGSDGRDYMKEKLKPHHEEVSTGSSVRHVTSEVGVEQPEQDIDMMAGIKSDFVGVHIDFFRFMTHC